MMIAVFSHMCAARNELQPCIVQCCEEGDPAGGTGSDQAGAGTCMHELQGIRAPCETQLGVVLESGLRHSESNLASFWNIRMLRGSSWNIGFCSLVQGLPHLRRALRSPDF